MVKVNVSQTQFSLSIAISVALTPKLNFSQISPRMSDSFEYVGPGLLNQSSQEVASLQDCGCCLQNLCVIEPIMQLNALYFNALNTLP